MRLLGRLLLGLVLLIFALSAGAYLLPRNVIVERQIVIDAAPEEVFEHIKSLQRFTEWSPWSGRDPDMQMAFSGPEEGVGNAMEWSSDEPSVGSGRQEIVSYVENERVTTELDFGGMGTAEAWWILYDIDAGTGVTWGLNADMGNSPIGRWMGLFMDNMVGPDYEAGLGNLQALVEG